MQRQWVAVMAANARNRAIRWIHRAATPVHPRSIGITAQGITAQRFSLLLLLGVLSLPAWAGDFVFYPFSTDLNPTTVGAGVTPTLNGGALTSFSIGNDGFGNVLEAYPSAGSTSAALALANSSFYTLSLSIAPGTFGPTVVNFNVAKGGASDPRGFFVRTSLDGFATDVLSQTLPSGPNQAPARQSFNLDLTGQSSVTLRFYVWTPDSNNFSVDFRNLEVASIVTATAVPTLNEWMLALLASMLLGFGGWVAWSKR
jgi:hypothetical protein